VYRSTLFNIPDDRHLWCRYYVILTSIEINSPSKFQRLHPVQNSMKCFHTVRYCFVIYTKYAKQLTKEFLDSARTKFQSRTKLAHFSCVQSSFHFSRHKIQTLRFHTNLLKRKCLSMKYYKSLSSSTHLGQGKFDVSKDLHLIVMVGINKE